MKTQSERTRRWPPAVTFTTKSVYSTDVFPLFPLRLQAIRTFHAAATFPTQRLSPSSTLTFSLKQDHACYHSKRAKGSFMDFNNGRDFALLRAAEWLLCCSPRSQPGFPRGARERGWAAAHREPLLENQTNTFTSPCLWLCCILNRY